MESHYDVIVVGAGAEMITCGRGLLIEGYSALVLEALQRSEGRAFSDSSADNSCNELLNIFSAAVTGNGETSSFFLLLQH